MKNYNYLLASLPFTLIVFIFGYAAVTNIESHKKFKENIESGENIVKYTCLITNFKIIRAAKKPPEYYFKIDNCNPSLSSTDSFEWNAITLHEAKKYIGHPIEFSITSKNKCVMSHKVLGISKTYKKNLDEFKKDSWCFKITGGSVFD